MQAYIAGVSPISILSNPKERVIKIIFAGCNFKCPYCNMKEIEYFKKEFEKDLKDVKELVKKYAEFSGSVIFTGCEPTLQRQALLDLARFARNEGLNIGIETNGSRPESIRSLFNENLFDFVAIDIKAPFEKTVFEKVTKSSTFFLRSEDIIRSIRETIGFLKEYQDRIEIEVRTTVVPGLIFRKEDFLEIAKEIKGLECRWVIQQFIPTKGLMNPKFESLKPPTGEFLEAIKEACQKEFLNLRIDIKKVIG